MSAVTLESVRIAVNLEMVSRKAFQEFVKTVKEELKDHYKRGVLPQGISNTSSTKWNLVMGILHVGLHAQLGDFISIILRHESETKKVVEGALKESLTKEDILDAAARTLGRPSAQKTKAKGEKKPPVCAGYTRDDVIRALKAYVNKHGVEFEEVMQCDHPKHLPQKSERCCFLAKTGNACRARCVKANGICCAQHMRKLGIVTFAKKKGTKGRNGAALATLAALEHEQKQKQQMTSDDDDDDDGEEEVIQVRRSARNKKGKKGKKKRISVDDDDEDDDYAARFGTPNDSMALTVA